MTTKELVGLARPLKRKVRSPLSHRISEKSTKVVSNLYKTQVKGVTEFAVTSTRVSVLVPI